MTTPHESPRRSPDGYFQRASHVQGLLIDRYALYQLGDNRGGFTIGQLMDMDIRDDVALLRSQYSGIWMWAHGFSLFLFAMPYVWFVAKRYTESTFLPLGEESISILHALGRFIWSGGHVWREEAEFSWWFMVFAAYLAFNVSRAALLYKTKRLESEQETKGIPVRFSFAEHSWWNRLYMINRLLFWIMMLLVLLNTFHFLLRRVPLS